MARLALLIVALVLVGDVAEAKVGWHCEKLPASPGKTATWYSDPRARTLKGYVAGERLPFNPITSCVGTWKSPDVLAVVNLCAGDGIRIWVRYQSGKPIIAFWRL